jgi:hypothetical protein
VVNSQSYPPPAAEPNAGSSPTVYLAPEQLEGTTRGNWIQTFSSQTIVAEAKLGVG